MENRLKYYQTAAYCVCFISLGLSSGTTGPTILLLANNIKETKDDTGAIFVVRSLGGILGSFIASYIYKYFSKRGHYVLSFTLIFTSINMSIIPFIGILWLLLSVNFMNGIVSPFLTVGANALLFSIWRDEVTPKLMFLHFSFGVGTTISPFIIAFLLKYSPSGFELRLSYWIMACLIFISCVIPLLVKSPQFIEKPKSDTSKPEDQKSKRRYYTLVFIMSLCLYLYCSAEAAFGAWIFTYSIDEYSLADADAAYITSIFWGVFTLGRLVSVFVSKKIKLQHILLVNVTCCVLCITTLILVEKYKIVPILWILSGFYGFVKAPMYPTIFSYASKPIGINIDRIVTSLFVVAGSLGGVTFPFIIGKAMRLISPTAMLTIILGVEVVLYIILHFVVFGIPKWYSIKN